MSYHGHANYGTFVAEVLSLWAQAFADCKLAASSTQQNEAIDYFIFLRHAVAAWPVDPLEVRHQQALLALADDTVRWAETLRDGGDAEPASRDMFEAVLGVHAEMARLLAARRARTPTPADNGG